MKPLQTNQRVLRWLCVYPADKKTGTTTKLAYIIFSIIVFIGIFSSLIASVAFFAKYVLTNLETALFAGSQIAAASSILYAIVMTLFSRKGITAIFQMLNSIYKDNEKEESYPILIETNNNCERMWNFYFKFAIGGFFASMPTMSIASSLFCLWLKGYFDPNFVYHPNKFILPWDQKTASGYFGEVCVSMICIEAYLIDNGALLLLFVSMCMHHHTFSKMFDISYRKLNHSDKRRNDMEQICKLIRFHISVKEWFLESAKVYSHVVLIQLICSMFFLACILFQLDLQRQHLDKNIMTILMATTVSSSNLFIYCYYGKVATESYQQMADCLFESISWWELPVDLQKYLLLMNANMQRLVFYHGFEIAVLNLETFCAIIRTTCSYFMAFKTFAE